FIAQGFSKLNPIGKRGDSYVWDPPTPEQILSGIKDIAPTMVGTAISVVQSAIEYARTPKDQRNVTSIAGNRLKGTAVRQMTGMSAGVQNVTVNMARRYSSEWKEATWLTDFRKELKAAGTPQARQKVVSRYGEQWDRLSAKFARLRNHAVATRHTPYQIRAALDDDATQI